ncbi:MAG: DEAD/DEAH box helicase [Chitinispirillaceae bacterium]|nr:DEAD/DEAH box helicase [Chitinispirillaceae bacterium]
MSFSNVGLSDIVQRGVFSSGYNRPTEIQRKAIPLAVAGKDLIGCAPTGTGKTAAFVLPILHCLGRSDNAAGKRGFPRALILTPTRELAVQIETAARTYGSHGAIRPIAIYGGVDIARQLRSLREGADIVVATPGRLIDHLERRSIDLSGIEILVVDEADRMFDMGFVNAVRKIIACLPVRRQTLLFSATMSREVKELTALIQKNPRLIEVGTPNVPVTTVEQRAYTVPQQAKTELLLHVLNTEAVETMLVFSRTKHGADRIARHLDRKGIASAAIHSNRSQSQRQKALEGFRKRRFKVLVATDVAARGIDVAGISHVVNFDTPRFAEDYVHRIGRTGRAEASGVAMTFVSQDERGFFNKIEHLIGRRFPIAGYPGFSHGGGVVAAAPAEKRPCFEHRRASSGRRRFRTRRS